MLGRLAGNWIMGRVRAEKMLLVCATGTVVTTSLVLLNVGTVSYTHLTIVGGVPAKLIKRIE